MTPTDESFAAVWEISTPRLSQVLRMRCQGLENKEIARELFISYQTVRTHMSRIFKSFGMRPTVGGSGTSLLCYHLGRYDGRIRG